MTYREALHWATQMLKEAGVEHPRLDAGVLAEHATGLSTVKLFNYLDEEIKPDAQEKLAGLLHRRAQRQPLQYLTGKQEFMSLEFLVSPSCLIPRGDTEILVQEALQLINDNQFRCCADVGTGSGAIGCSIAYYSKATVWAVDISAQALDLARKNAHRLGVDGSMRFLHGDLLTPLIDNNIKLELITANLPYIPTAQLTSLAPELSHEPCGALDGGADGLDFYRQLLPLITEVLLPGGYLLLEIGWDQGKAMLKLTEQYPWVQALVMKDFGGRDRVVKIKYIKQQE